MPVFTFRDPGPVHLLGQDGRRYDFSSLLALSHWLASRISRRRGAYRHWDLSIGPAFRVRVDRDWLGQPYYREYDFILRDAQGNPLEPWIIPAPAWAEKWKRGQRGPVPVWRRGPVPRTGYKGGSHTDTLRYPRTQAARKAGQAPVDDNEPIVRRARSPVALPTAWDDAPRGCQRSWKAHRRTQWKPARRS